MVSDLSLLIDGFRGQTIEDLLKRRATKQNMDETLKEIEMWMDDLQDKSFELLNEYIDSTIKMQKDDWIGFGASSCEEALVDMMKKIESFFVDKHGIQMDEDEKFAVLEIILLNYAYNIQLSAMKFEEERKKNKGPFRRFLGI